MNEAQIIVTGNLANKPSLGTTPTGVSVANMRLGYTPRRLDRESGQWVDGQTSWVTVKCWRKLADHAAMALGKGDPVVVKGVLQVRQYTDKDGNPRQVVEVLASAIGHDLNRGLTHFFRTGRKSGGLAGTQGEAATEGLGQPGSGQLTAGQPTAGQLGAGELGAGELGAGQPGTEAVDGNAGGGPDGLRSVPGFPWDRARDGAGDDLDADMFDETAVVAAALHAVPDLEDGATASEDGATASDEEPGKPASAVPAPRQDSTQGPEADREKAANVPQQDPVTTGTASQPRPARGPGQRKAGERKRSSDNPGTGRSPDDPAHYASKAPKEPQLT